MPGTPHLPALFKCDACRREVDYVRASLWHGESRICRDCFTQWYDPDNDSFNHCDPIELGNYVRKKHGLPPISSQQRAQGE